MWAATCVFVTASYFHQPSLIFASKVGVYPSGDWTPKTTLHENIRLGWKRLAMINAANYNGAELITAVSYFKS